VRKVLIVGFGSIGQRHLRLIRESLPSAEIMIFRHQRTNSIPKLANFVACSIDEVRKFSPEVAVIANPAPFHLKISMVLATLGCHLLIEKPISDTPDGVLELVKSCRAAEVICQVGYNMRYLPSLLRFRDFINAGLIGRPLAVRCEVGQYLPCWRPEADYKKGVSANRRLGGGVLLELSHEVDYLRWMFGEVDWVSSWVGNVGDLAIDVEDTAHLIFSCRFSHYSKPVIVNLNMDFIRQDMTRTCTVIGECGSLRWNGVEGIVEVYESRGKGWRELVAVPYEPDESYRAQWRDFLDCIARSRKPLVDAVEALKVLEIIDAARLSAENNGIQKTLNENKFF
jgi:predicted dehydrogenase